MRNNSKIIILATAALLCLSQILFAIPAKPGKHTRVQPDGSTITIVIHGDEWFHYITDEKGTILVENEEGYLVPAPDATPETIGANMTMANKAKANALKAREEAITKAAASGVSGSPKIPVILVQFTDKSFSISNPKTAFSNLLNQHGYSANGGTGSVLDYYTDQSRGAFTPQFVVMDVVTLSGRMSTYGRTDENAAKALYEACQKLDSSVDFSQFDNDGDGKIDMALMYYAGYNEAEGASSDTIWPHQYYVPYIVTNAQAFDGVKLNRYFCTSELKGTSGARMCGIGTTCHEFAHSLGLPDFYDTNYNEYGDGEAGGTYDYDVMCDGGYNNGGCTPPWMGAEELIMLGWMDSITEITGKGLVTVPSIGNQTPVAYKTPTSDSGEYFLYECRPGTDWDSPLAGGLLIYHVDKSRTHRITWKTTSTASTSQLAYNLWNTWEAFNAINCNGSHPCYYVIPSGNPTSLYYTGSAKVFPGSYNVKTYTPIEWAGTDTGFSLSQIAFNSTDKTASFVLTNTNEPTVSGSVTDTDGAPIQGATITVRTAAVTSAPLATRGLSRKISVMKASGNTHMTTTTDATGSYSIDLGNGGTYIIEASKDGYVSKSATVDVSRPVTQNFTLLREGETLPSELILFPTDGNIFGVGSDDDGTWEYMAANCYPASLMSSYVGKQIKSISFAIDAEADESGHYASAGKVYGALYFGENRKAYIEVTSPVVNAWNTVDLVDLDIRVPAGQDIFAGYALDGCDYNYPFLATDPDGVNTGYLADLGETAEWVQFEQFIFIIKMTLGDYTEPETGYNYIENPKGGQYLVGDEFVFNLVETASERKPNYDGVYWFYDDDFIEEPAITLTTPGTHTITAKFITEANAWKVIELEINVN